MFFAVVHLGPNGTEILYLSTDGIAAVREVDALCNRKLKSIPHEKIINTNVFLGYAEIETANGSERWIAAPFHGTKENLKTFVNQLKGRL